MTEDLSIVYEGRYQRILMPAAQSLEKLLRDYLKDINRCDRIYARAKTPQSFAKKAAKLGPKGPKYEDPLGQIQDQIAARIIVFFKDDVEPARVEVLKYFRHAEQTMKEPESDWAFGYFGLHLVLAFPSDVLPAGVDPSEGPRLFELQIRTLFEHSWSEANHDLGFKPGSNLTSEQTRWLAFTAAQAWGADRIFNDLQREQKAAGAATTRGA